MASPPNAGLAVPGSKSASRGAQFRPLARPIRPGKSVASIVGVSVERQSPFAPLWKIALAAVLVGISSGISGIAVSLALRGIEHLAYGYNDGSFLSGVIGSDPGRRVLALFTAGAIGGGGWWLLRRFGPAIVSVAASVAGARMPALATLANTGLQVLIVGLGASIGREVAPRELGALLAGWLSDRTGIGARERRVLIACGAGAGLAAVYSVPLGGAVFALEILLSELTIATAMAAIVTSAVASLVAFLILPAGPLYGPLAEFTASPSLVVFAIVAGPVLGAAAVGFNHLTFLAERFRPGNVTILIAMPVIFTAVGLLAIPFPAILGNGQSLGSLAFSGAAPLATFAALAILKLIATIATIGSGAAGGTLTPSLAIGAALGATLGGLWLLVWPGSVVGAFALVASAAFLGVVLRGPLTALVLVLEFTGQGPALLLPMVLAIAGASSVGFVLGRHRRLTGVD